MIDLYECMVGLKMKLVGRLFRVNRSRAEVVGLLESILSRTISDEDWDYFISVKIADKELEEVRERLEEMWTSGSPYMMPGRINPCDLNSKGVAEVRRLIDSLRR